jgi:ABC-2 type transport system ATP-binding protein
MIIKMENVSKIFNKKTKALQNVNMEFKKNKITGLIGFNGSGKTTTFNILTNFIESYKGTVTFDGKKINKNIRQKISYLSAGAEPRNPMRTITHLYQMASLYQVKKSKAKKIIYDLSKKIDFTQFLKKPIKSLSKGNQQKIKFISILLNPNVEILFLDEPFDGLDPIMVNKIKKIFMEMKNTTIIVTSHRMNVVQEMCDDFYILKDGILIDKKKTSESKIYVSFNKEIPIKKIKLLNYVSNIKKTNKEIILEIKDIKDFKKLNKLLISLNQFV